MSVLESISEMNRFRTVFSIFFLLIFTFNVFIYYSLFEFSEYEIKREMSFRAKSPLAEDEATVFKLPLNRLADTRGKEIWMNDQVYDIVKTEIKKDYILVYVLCDKEETALIGDLGKHVQDNLENNAQSHSKSSKIPLKKPLQKYLAHSVICFIHISNGEIISCELDSLYASPEKSVQAPPPDHRLS